MTHVERHAAIELRCPKCAAQLRAAQNGGVACSACEQIFPKVGGILHFCETARIHALYGEVAHQTRVGARFYNAVVTHRFADILGVSVPALRDAYLSRIRWQPGARVLCVGAGTGTELPCVQACCAGVELHAIDLSTEMLQYAQRCLADERVDARLYVALAEELPFADDQFDVVFHMGAFNEFAHKAAALHEMLRVARPSGQILIADDYITTSRSDEVATRLRTAFPSMTLDPPLPSGFIDWRVADLREEMLLGGNFYCTTFRKPAMHT